MSDRSLRLLTLTPQSVLLRERPASPPDAPSGKKNGDTGGTGANDDGQGSAAQDDNPFAPPPEGTPDRPWQPRRPAGDDASGDGGNSPWGSLWSDRQPGRSPGVFGDRTGRSGGQGGQGGPEGQGDGQGTNPRWDPTDPAQRQARYALLCGMWAFFFALFNWPYVALLLGALALNWGIGALRAKPRTPNPDTPAPAQGTGGGGRPQRTAAISGLVTASLALLMVAGTFSLQFMYRDYYTCANDALTTTAEKACNDLLPEPLQKVFGTNS
ncbi:hypothetical protein [Streptomyces sp. SID12488]|uniref:hypothetical protein n=1 Tax=Streptomyces sp. SID12488 TaxID=2706040 RepID=UPI0013DAECB5|nr:hypothetical protein [Streptomyces sp. SID12488]NEA62322.1 hypothetical protein [Streptomyces sp. SID12488]